MKKTFIIVLLSIIAFSGGIYLNYLDAEFLSIPNAKNITVTSLYITIWILLLFIATKSKSKLILIYCLVFWIISLFSSIMTTGMLIKHTNAIMKK